MRNFGNIMREVKDWDDLVATFEKDRIVTIWNATARNREYRKGYQKSYKSEMRADAAAFRKMTEQAKQKGVSIQDLLKQL